MPYLGLVTAEPKGLVVRDISWRARVGLPGGRRDKRRAIIAAAWNEAGTLLDRLEAQANDDGEGSKGEAQASGAAQEVGRSSAEVEEAQAKGRSAGHPASVSPRASNRADVIGRDLYSSHGDKIGTAHQVYTDDETGQPEWVTVAIKTGLFGTKKSFIPLGAVTRSGDDIIVTFEKDFVAAAPDVAEEKHLSPAQKQELYAYYNAPITAVKPTTPSGTTEETVQVQREEVTIEREPISEGNRDDTAPEIPEAEEHEVVLHGERPVVEKKAVPVERVRLDTETVTDAATISEVIRKERVEAEGVVDSDEDYPRRR